MAGTKSLVGSPVRDLMKWLHKQFFPANFYASDLDLCLIDRDGVVAHLDFKRPGESVTFAERVLYRELISNGGKVFLVYVKTDENLARWTEWDARTLATVTANARYDVVSLAPDDNGGVEQIRDLTDASVDVLVEWEAQLRNGRARS